MEEKESQNPPKKQENILEKGKYFMKGPENGDISIDTIELRSTSGARRIWKVESLSEEKIVLKVIKFG